MCNSKGNNNVRNTDKGQLRRKHYIILNIADKMYYNHAKSSVINQI